MAEKTDVQKSGFRVESVPVKNIKRDEDGNQIVASIDKGNYSEKTDNDAKRPRRNLHETFDTTGNTGSLVD